MASSKFGGGDLDAWRREIVAHGPFPGTKVLESNPSLHLVLDKPNVRVYESPAGFRVLIGRVEPDQEPTHDFSPDAEAEASYRVRVSAFHTDEDKRDPAVIVDAPCTPEELPAALRCVREVTNIFAAVFKSEGVYSQLVNDEPVNPFADGEGDDA